MNLKKLGAAVAVSMAGALAFTAVPAAAQSTETPRADKRQANQEKRIEQGKATGALTEKEAAKLEKGQAKVQKVEDKAKADGKVTKKEKAKIEHVQDHQSKKIAKQKHDKQKDAPATTPTK